MCMGVAQTGSPPQPVRLPGQGLAEHTGNCNAEGGTGPARVAGRQADGACGPGSPVSLRGPSLAPRPLGLCGGLTRAGPHLWSWGSPSAGDGGGAAFPLPPLYQGAAGSQGWAALSFPWWPEAWAKPRNRHAHLGNSLQPRGPLQPPHLTYQGLWGGRGRRRRWPALLCALAWYRGLEPPAAPSRPTVHSPASTSLQPCVWLLHPEQSVRGGGRPSL